LQPPSIVSRPSQAIRHEKHITLVRRSNALNQLRQIIAERGLTTRQVKRRTRPQAFAEFRDAVDSMDQFGRRRGWRKDLTFTVAMAAAKIAVVQQLELYGELIHRFRMWRL
jgi:hypothetical protein